LLVRAVRPERCMPCSERHSTMAVRHVHTDTETEAQRRRKRVTHMHNVANIAEVLASQHRLNKSGQRHGVCSSKFTHVESCLGGLVSR